MASEDPTRRRQATDPSFRSVGAVWAQYYLARRTRRPDERWRAPVRLRETWQEFEEDPQSALAAADEFRLGLVAEANPYRVTDQAALRLFVADVAGLLDECVQLIRSLPMSRASNDLVASHVAAWVDLRAREVVASVVDELDGAEVTERLDDVGLTGVHLGVKLTGWFRALSEWREARTADALRRAFRWANVMLGSLGKVVAGLGLDLFRVQGRHRSRPR